MALDTSLHNYLSILHDILVLLTGNAGGAAYETLLARIKAELEIELGPHFQALLDAHNNPAGPPEPTPEELLAAWRAKQAEGVK